MLILGIESTCDETAAAVVKDGKEILSNVIASQIDVHKQYGGVFPEMASRFHIDRMLPVIDQALNEAHITSADIDVIAVAYGPGLIGSLLVGVNIAKTLALAWNKLLIGINHIEAHLYAAMMENDKIFPSIGVVLSGGHTQILHMPQMGKYSLIGTTIDDAIGEAFDKTASILGLEYPGGPQVEKLAKEGDANRYPFTVGEDKNNAYNFSFSGIKTKVLYTVKGQGQKKRDDDLIAEEEKKHVAASFQRACFSSVIDKVITAMCEYPTKAIYLGGGVTNNRKLREMFADKCLDIPIFWPSFALSLDNAAMIAGLAYHKQEEFSSTFSNLEVATRISLTK
jgi:N6-L-threonylcarbamoyladenine synthase